MPFDPYQTELCAALLIDDEDVVRRAGSGCKPILHQEPDGIEGNALFSLFDPEHRDRLERGLANVRAGAPSAMVHTRTVAIGAAMDVVVRLEQQDDGVFALIEDVSSRAAVMEEYSQMAHLVDFAADAWFVHDTEGRLRDANPFACASLGYTREEMLALQVADFETTIKPGRMDGVWNRMDLGKPVTVTGRHKRKDGSTYPVSVRLGLFQSGDEVLMLAICRDITELKAAEERLSELNAGLEAEVARQTAEVRKVLGERQAILDHLVDGIVAVDEKGVVQFANPALRELLGVPVRRGAGSDVLPADLAALVSDAADLGEVVQGEITLPGERIGQVIASPVLDDALMVGVVAHVRDVTLEREVDRMKTDFIATVSHELRTPLTSVLGFAKITRNKLVQSVFDHVPADDRRGQRAVSQTTKNLDIIVSEGERLTSLINDVLDISKMEAGRMEWRFSQVDIAALADRVHNAASSLFSEGVAFTVDADPDLPEVIADPDRILQVLMNLVSNAAKFTDEGSVTLALRRRGRAVEIAVEDTGRGIDASEQHHVFDKFKQVGDTLTDKPKGTGLGLPICSQIVAAHGSTFALTSELGRGSRFSFVLGADGSGNTDPTPAAPERTKVAELGSTGADILVVDDDPNLRELLHQQLEEQGYRVRLAADGYEAIRLARESKPSLVLLDVMMPVLSGFDVAAMLRNDPELGDVPILMLSIVRDEERGQQSGADLYFTKPADADEIARAVRELLGDAAASEP